MKTPRKLFKFADRRHVEKIDDRDVRAFDSLRITRIESRERGDPGVKELEGAKLVSTTEFLKRRIGDIQLAKDSILVHTARAVRVDLAEIEVPGILVVEDIEARHRQELRRIDGRRRKNQLLELRIEREQFAIGVVEKVLADRLDKDPTSRRYDPAKVVDRFFGKDLRELNGFGGQSIFNPKGRTSQIFLNRKRADTIIVDVRGDKFLKLAIEILFC